MVEEIVKTYHVAYERDASGWWVASVRELRGCHTQGRTVDEARRRIREALDLFVDDARRAPIRGRREAAKSPLGWPMGRRNGLGDDGAILAAHGADSQP